MLSDSGADQAIAEIQGIVADIEQHNVPRELGNLDHRVEVAAGRERAIALLAEPIFVAASKDRRAYPG